MILSWHSIAILSNSVTVFCAMHDLTSGNGGFLKKVWLGGDRIFDYGETAEFLGRYMHTFSRSFDERTVMSAGTVSPIEDA
jgi:hypothetical protein